MRENFVLANFMEEEFQGSEIIKVVEHVFFRNRTSGSGETIKVLY
jgi:hypothetical protein